MIQQARTNHPRSVEGAALHLACLWWVAGMTTREEKNPILLDAVRAIGKIRFVNWVEDMLRGGIDCGDSTSAVVGGTEHPQSSSMVEDGTEYPRSPSLVVGGTEHLQSPSVVMGGIEHPQSPSMVVGGTERPQSPSVVMGGIEHPQSPSVLVGATEHPQSPAIVVGETECPEMAGVVERPDVSSVMVVDEIEERSNVVVPIRERFVGSANPADVQRL